MLCGGKRLMSRGFVTIATGTDNYYKIAVNLLQSYRYYAEDPEPFAIICDRTNEYTDLFDKVMIMDDPCFHYVDKLRLPEFLPFDETIFIDADCLAYKDLNCFWDIFKDAEVFSVFGRNYPKGYQYGWFREEDVGEYRDRVSYIPDFIGGVFYFRKTDELEKFYEIVKHIKATYNDYKFRQFEKLADEPTYALAMSVCGFKTMDDKSPDICFYPHTTYFESDIAEGKVNYKDKYMKKRGLISEAYMVHWGSGNTRRSTYLMEVYRLNHLLRGKQIRQAGLKAAELKIKARIFAGRAFRKSKAVMKAVFR